MGVTIREFDAPGLMQIACGFDSLAGEVKGTTVEGVLGPVEGGNQVIFSLFRVDSVEDFLSALEISASISMQASFGRGGAKARYAQTIRTHRYSLYLAAVVTVRSGTRQLQNPNLDPTASQLLTTNDGREQFRKMYGDEYLAGVTVGGEFIGIIEIQTSNRTEQEAVAASISGSDAVGANTGKASFRSFLQRLRQTSQLKVSSFQNGGNDPTPAVTPESLIAKAIAFPQTVDAASEYSYLATFQTYDVLPRPAGPGPLDVQNQQDWLERLSLYRLRYQQVVDSIEYVLDNPQQFVPFDSATLSSRRNELNVLINNLMGQASRCFNDYTQCSVPVDLPDPVVDLPERLSRPEAEGLERARQAATKAQEYAVAAKGHASEVAEIRRSIQAGPNGTRLADKAKLELSNADRAAQMAQTEADNALLARDATPAAMEFATAARSASQQAKEAAQRASELSDEAYRIGYAPYWTAPKRIVLGLTNSNNAYEWRGTTLISWGAAEGRQFRGRNLDVGRFTNDPKGGIVTISGESGELKQTSHYISWEVRLAPGKNVRLTLIGKNREALSNSDPSRGGYFIMESPFSDSDIANFTYDYTIRLTSQSSGLSSTVNIQLYNHLSGVNVDRPYLSGELDTIN